MGVGLRIIVAAHKPYPMPDDPAYLPIQVGAYGKESIGFERDDSGDHISGKNRSYCELTGLYWAWKNLDAKTIGLVHYRRHFADNSMGVRCEIEVNGRRIGNILSSETAKKILEDSDVIVPKKRRYFIESLFGHYAHTLDGNHLIEARRIIAEKEPDLIPVVDDIYSRTWGYMFNMFIMSRELTDDYCSWLFPILGELEDKVADPGASAFEARVCGRVSEILFNVWLEKKKREGIRIHEQGVVYTESVNWVRKITAFLAAKFGGGKYKESF